MILSDIGRVVERDTQRSQKPWALTRIESSILSLAIIASCFTLSACGVPRKDYETLQYQLRELQEKAKPCLDLLEQPSLSRADTMDDLSYSLLGRHE